MTKNHPALTPFIDVLRKERRLRVWSIVISIFGDLVQPRGGEISLQELLSLTAPLGIEDGAVRTALSRLAKEGWVQRSKDGRRAFYRVAPVGEDAFFEATTRIYLAQFESKAADWQIEILPDPASPSSEYFQISPQVVLREGKAEPNAFRVVSTPENIPDWVIERAIGPELSEGYEALLPLLEGIDLAAIDDPLVAQVLRYLSIHFWRRLVLRHPLLPHGLVPGDWPGVQCHQRLVHLYPQLVSIGEAWWENPTPAGGARQLATRFRN